MINIRYCKKCNQAYDIGINFDTCAKCRLEKRGNLNGKKERNKQLY